MQVRRRTQAERRADTKRRLLAASREVFAERGYQGASLDLVSERAGCTKGALYHHFGSKEGIFLALLDEQITARVGQAREASSERPSERMPFDRQFSILFLEFVCAAARDARLRRRLASRLRTARKPTVVSVGDERLAAVLSAAANGAAIEAIVFGEQEGAATFDAAVAMLAPGSS